MDCLKCGFTNPDNARFCAGCGASVATLECAHCNSQNSPGSRFCNNCGNSLVSETKKLEPTPTSQAERRLLTVMFCDLVNSTTIVDNLDPEETRSIIRDFQSLSLSIIEQFGGRITEYLGDGIVAQFTRHETNAERALNAALELIRKLEKANIKIGTTDQIVEVRCGIATGLAVVGDMLGDARIRSESAIGLPLNLAARIQSLAKPGEIVIAGDTHRLTRGLFEFEDLGRHALKGIKVPHQVWRVVKDKHISSRFIAHTAEITPMVDREEAMEVLLNRWESSKQGKADAVVFTGEAGIGKSRILQELGSKIAVDDFFYLEYQCAPYHTNTALYPLISRLEAAAEFEHSDSTQQRLLKLEDLVSRSSGDYEIDMPAFVNLLSLPAEEKWPAPNLDPDEKKEWIFSVLINNMFSLAKSKPLLIKIEDVHWIDPTTLELMSRMVKSLTGHHILLLITSRPGFEADFMEESHVTLLEIDRLPEQYTAELVEGVKGSSTLPKDVIDEIIHRTEGIPLFAEELSKSLLESMSASDSQAQSTLLAKKDIPTTLHDSLLSRLDRLPEASRAIAQLAAVIGRDFSFDLLEQVANYKDKNLYQDLTPLLESQLVFQDKAPPSAEFCFKHALVRDVAYENLLQSERADIHKRIALAIEQNYPEIIKNSPELVARHFTEGKEYEKAVQYWLAAGIKASESSANVEARNHLEKALTLLEFISHQDDAIKYELRILLTLGPIFMSTYGTGATETHNIYKRALEISNDDSESELRFVALWNRWRMSVDEGFLKVVRWADELLNFAQRTKNVEQLLQAHHCQWGTLYNLGEQVLCCQHIESGIKYYDEKRHGQNASTYGGHDPKVCGYSQSALSLWLMGDYQQAETRIQQGQQWADHLNHLGTHLHQIDISLMYYRFLNEPDNVLKHIEKLKQLIDLNDYQDYSSKVKIYSGWSLGLLHETHTALNILEQGVIEHNRSGTWEDKPVFLEMSAQIKSKFEDFNSAINDIELALENTKISGVAYWNAELYRRKAELYLAKDGSKAIPKAIRSFVRAIEIAEQQNAGTLQLRASIGLANTYLDQGERTKSLSVIKPVLDKFSDQKPTQDIQRAIDLAQSLQDRS